MKEWILNKITKNKNTENKIEMKKFNDLLSSEIGKEILIETFKIGFVEGYEADKKC